MSVQNDPPLGAIRLDELVALNDEIGALIRAGVPLEQGLAELGGDISGRLGALMSRLAQDAARGRSLGEALADPATGIPPIYRAVVAAGLRAGRLPAALESVSGSIRRLTQMHRCIAVALVYPALVVVLAWVLFAGFTVYMAPRLVSTTSDIHVPGRELWATFASWGHSAAYWGPALPLLVIVLGGVWAWRAQNAVSMNSNRGGMSLLWMPWLGPMLRWSRAAVFTDLLATLVENRVPLHEALTLAGDASGDRNTAQAARSLAAALERGEPIGAHAANPATRVLPPLLLWLLQSTRGQDTLLSALRHVADTYRSRAQYQAGLAQVLLPVAATLVIGGGATLAYTLAVFWPYISILRAISS